ncbi:50S ribosomal protein L23 [Halosquirtibacter laminarini]|uniref:50S ribosomal protein L23 n=1 Tax=Halosquirtibacter laminarini TaxID=3374600 RepID=A0AC61NNJ6_9BACT|nr:50S ribosomal protein L23 [Prolixibacteraceae bacterium]
MNVLVRPIVTEKMTEQQETLNSYGFVVLKSADKGQIKRAIEAMYGVEVDSVNTMVYAGKRKMRYTKTGVQNGKTASFKKAIVTLKEGGVIDFYSNI